MPFSQSLFSALTNQDPTQPTNDPFEAVARMRTRYQSVGVTPPDPQVTQSVPEKLIKAIDYPDNIARGLLLEGFEGAKQAAKGQKTFSVGDTLRANGADSLDSKVGGFIGDVVLSPTTYLGGGLVKHAGAKALESGVAKGAAEKLAGNALDRTVAQHATEATGKTAQDITDSLTRTLSGVDLKATPTDALKQMGSDLTMQGNKDLVTGTRKNLIAQTGDLGKAQESFNATFKQLVRNTKVKDADKADMLTKALSGELKNTNIVVGSPIEDIAAHLESKLDTTLTTEQRTAINNMKVQNPNQLHALVNIADNFGTKIKGFEVARTMSKKVMNDKFINNLMAENQKLLGATQAYDDAVIRTAFTNNLVADVTKLGQTRYIGIQIPFTKAIMPLADISFVGKGVNKAAELAYTKVPGYKQLSDWWRAAITGEVPRSLQIAGGETARQAEALGQTMQTYMFSRQVMPKVMDDLAANVFGIEGMGAGNGVRALMPLATEHNVLRELPTGEQIRDPFTTVILHNAVENHAGITPEEYNKAMEYLTSTGTQENIDMMLGKALGALGVGEGKLLTEADLELARKLADRGQFSTDAMRAIDRLQGTDDVEGYLSNYVKHMFNFKELEGTVPDFTPNATALGKTSTSVAANNPRKFLTVGEALFRDKNIESPILDGVYLTQMRMHDTLKYGVNKGLINGIDELAQDADMAKIFGEFEKQLPYTHDEIKMLDGTGSPKTVPPVSPTDSAEVRALKERFTDNPLKVTKSGTLEGSKVPGQTTFEYFDGDYHIRSTVEGNKLNVTETRSFVEPPKPTNIGYHGGDLGKAEYLESMSGSRGTGHFGTGTYFVGSKDAPGFSGVLRGDRPVVEHDFSGYNLYKPTSLDQGRDLHDALKSLSKFAYNEGIITPPAELMDELHALFPDKNPSQLFAAVRDAKNQVENNYDFIRMERRKYDSPTTVFMKSLGYEGIDVRGIRGLDDTEFGSVIYDIKKSTAAASVPQSVVKDIAASVRAQTGEKITKTVAEGVESSVRKTKKSSIQMVETDLSPEEKALNESRRAAVKATIQSVKDALGGMEGLKELSQVLRSSKHLTREQLATKMWEPITEVLDLNRVHTGGVTWYVHKDLKPYIDLLKKPTSDVTALRSFLEFTDGATRMLKRLQTTYSPAFIPRNIAGELMGSMSNGSEIKDFEDAFSLLRSMEGKAELNGKAMYVREARNHLEVMRPTDRVTMGGVEMSRDEALQKLIDANSIDIGGGKKMTLQDLRMSANRQGLLTSGHTVEYQNADMEKLATRLGGKNTPLQQAKYAFNENKGIGKAKAASALVEGSAEFVDSYFRLADYIHNLRAGMTETEAALRVKMFHVDYHNLTQVEKTLLRRVVPYYTFMRRNIPMQLRMIMERPAYLGTLGKLINNSYAALGNPATPDYLHKSMALPLYKDDDGNVHYLQWNLPVSDLAKFRDNPKETMQELWQMLHPGLRALPELASGTNIGFGTPINPADYLASQLGGASTAYKAAKEVAVPPEQGQYGQPTQVPLLSTLLPTKNPEKEQLARAYRYREQLLADMAERKKAGQPIPELKNPLALPSMTSFKLPSLTPGLYDMNSHYQGNVDWVRKNGLKFTP